MATNAWAEMCDRRDNEILALKAELDGADKVISKLKADQTRISVGDFNLYRSSLGTLYLENKIGEAMELNAEGFERLLAEYFKDHF